MWRLIVYFRLIVDKSLVCVEYKQLFHSSHSGESVGVTYDINDGSVVFKYPKSILQINCILYKVTVTVDPVNSHYQDKE